jgi:hypothetical protein
MFKIKSFIFIALALLVIVSATGCGMSAPWGVTDGQIHPL